MSETLQAGLKLQMLCLTALWLTVAARKEQACSGAEKQREAARMGIVAVLQTSDWPMLELGLMWRALEVQRQLWVAAMMQQTAVLRMAAQPKPVCWGNWRMLWALLALAALQGLPSPSPRSAAGNCQYRPCRAPQLTQ